MDHRMPPTRMMTQKTRFDLPGYTLPFDWFPVFKDTEHPDWKTSWYSPVYPSGLNKTYVKEGILDRIYHYREIVMMQIMNEITEKADWEEAIYDEKTISEWWREFSGSEGDMTYVEVAQDLPLACGDIPGLTTSGYQEAKIRNKPYQDVTPRVMTYLVKELQWRAAIFKQKKLVNVFDGVVKSDNLISSVVRRDLIDACRSIELGPRPIPPNSDFVHTFNPVDPSLYPLVYGRSRILPDQTIIRDDCISTAGKGTVIHLKSRNEPGIGPADHPSRYHEGFQHLPCDVSLSGKGCQIVSYINNAHPTRDRKFYDVLEKVISKALPLWSDNLKWLKLESNRIPLPAKPHRPELDEECTCRCHGDNDYLYSDNSDDTDDDRNDDHAEWQCPCTGFLEPGDFAPGNLDRGQMRWVNSNYTVLPEPVTFQPRLSKPVNLKRDFLQDGLQVIVKLETVELTPEHPRVEESEWHLAGQPNEYVCATAVYCYEVENMEEQSLGFRHRMGHLNRFYGNWQDGNVFEWLDYLRVVFRGITLSGPIGDGVTAVQDRGNVPIRQGRLLTFPNYLQQQRSSLSLADKTKPGHCKTLLLYLVDPHLRIVSTANIPPQREDWTHRQDFIAIFLRSRLPEELVVMIEEYLNVHEDYPISQKESEWYRWALQDARQLLAKKQNALFEKGSSRI